MNVWQEALIEFSNALCSDDGFGESVTLADGNVVYGVFHRQGGGDSWGSGVGLSQRISDQSSPRLDVPIPIVSLFPKKSVVVVRGVRYTVERHESSDEGLASIYLMPSEVSNAQTGARWQ